MIITKYIIRVHIIATIFVIGCNDEEKKKQSQFKITTNEEFNELYSKANKRNYKIVHLGGYNPRNKPNSLERDKLNQSINDYKRCLSFAHNHWQSMVFIAKTYQALGDHKNSLMWLERAMEIEKNDHAIPQEASIEAIHLNDIMKAVNFSYEALKRKQNDPALLGNHAMNLLIAKKDIEARKTIDLALTINPDDEFNRRILNMIKKVSTGQRKRPTCQSIFN